MNPFDLPVHPAVVHFPIALLTVAWVARLWAYSFASDPWRERSQIMETIGVAVLPVTIIAGFIDTRGLDFVFDPQWDQPPHLAHAHLARCRRSLDHPLADPTSSA